MGDALSSIFIDPEALSGSTAQQLIQLSFLICTYGYIIFKASEYISDGSQLLLLTPYSNIVGSVFLPIVGAVPDAMIVLFSGLGHNVKDKIDIGVGDLAGSTIMLLTLPWFFANLGGRVDLKNNGEGNYNAKVKLHRNRHKCGGLFTTGIHPLQSVRVGGKMIALTALPYVLIQMGGFVNPYEGPSHDSIAWLMLFSSFLSFVFFFFYLYFQFKNQDEAFDDRIVSIKMQKIKKGQVTFQSAFQNELQEVMEDAPELKRGEKKINKVLKLFFRKYERQHLLHLRPTDLRSAVVELGQAQLLHDPQFNQYLDFVERRKKGLISFIEFANSCNSSLRASSENGDNYQIRVDFMVEAKEPLLPQQEMETTLNPTHASQARLIFKSVSMMIMGAIVVVIFSDPMVKGINTMGDMVGISSFYVSFFLSPLVSDAIEILVAYQYSRKKTQKHITIALSQIQGSVVMNNTLCLGLFLMLIASNQELTWKYTAEMIGILVVEGILVLVSMRRLQKMWMACLVVLCHPMSVFLILLMKRVILWN